MMVEGDGGIWLPTHVWMLLDGHVDLLGVDDGGPGALGQDQGLLHVAVYLEQIPPHLPDLCKDGVRGWTLDWRQAGDRQETDLGCGQWGPLSCDEL